MHNVLLSDEELSLVLEGLYGVEPTHPKDQEELDKLVLRLEEEEEARHEQVA